MATAIWYTDRGQVSLRSETLRPVSQHDAKVRTLYSAMSRGTERLVLLGAVPQAEHARMRAPLQVGEFPFPVKYGYCAVGVVEEGPDELKGHVTFCLHPHQDYFVAPLSTLIMIPPGIPAKRATLAANLETALNAHWDAGTRPGDRVIVIGGGVVGLLTAYLASQIAGTDVTLIDLIEKRRAIAEAFDIGFATSLSGEADADVVFHTSATAAGLQLAIEAAGLEASVVEMSWYGTQTATVALGGAFHSKRLTLISSQVGHVAPARRARWDFRRRLATAIKLLDHPALDLLVADEIAFGETPKVLPSVLTKNTERLPPIIRYP